jgi:hypothetical protein
MANFASTDVTITVRPNDRNIAGVGGASKDIVYATIAFGDGNLQYATGGVPLPAIGNFGLLREIDLMLIEQPSANGFIYKYDHTAHKIKIFTQGFSTGITAAVTLNDKTGALVKNSAGIEATGPRMPDTAASTTYDMGPMIELPNGTAPAAVTLRALVIGN